LIFRKKEKERNKVEQEEIFFLGLFHSFSFLSLIRPAGRKKKGWSYDEKKNYARANLKKSYRIEKSTITFVILLCVFLPSIWWDSFLFFFAVSNTQEENLKKRKLTQGFFWTPKYQVTRILFDLI
jgi:hypothetical protein